MKAIQRRYIRFFCYGYLNTYYSSVANVSNNESKEFIKRKIQTMLDYKGFANTKLDFITWGPLWLILEIIISIPILIYQVTLIVIKWLFVKHQHTKGYNLVIALSLDNNRMKDILRVLSQDNLYVLDIPFKKNRTELETVKVISGISFSDIVNSLLASVRTVFYMVNKYGKRDVLFRAYASFSFYLTCFFIEHNKDANTYVYYSTYSRWAYPLCQYDVKSVFIQHGVIFDRTYIRVGTPTEAYYIDVEQRRIVERRLFSKVPKFMGYRPHMEFTSNEKLLKNGRINVLIVGVSFYFDKQKEILDAIREYANVYIKPHPRDTNIDEYNQLSKEYGCVILEKIDHPKVDMVLSYASTLADEYKLVGVEVVRYDLIGINQIKEIVSKHS